MVRWSDRRGLSQLSASSTTVAALSRFVEQLLASSRARPLRGSTGRGSYWLCVGSERRGTTARKRLDSGRHSTRDIVKWVQCLWG